MILAIRTDNPQAEVGLCSAEGERLEYIKWQAHRELSATIHKKIEQLLILQGVSLQEVDGVIFYEGPGSFTGLRIGASVANTLSDQLDIPIATASGEKWQQKATKKLSENLEKRFVVPDYGQPPRITRPKK